MRAPIIDFHIHVAPGEWVAETVEQLMIDIVGSREKLETLTRHFADPAAMVAQLHKDGVDYGVILAEDCPLVTGKTSNEVVEAYCRDHKELIPFGTINPYNEPDMRARVRDLKARGFMGIKLHPTYCHFYINEKRMYPLYEAAQDVGLPLLFHTGTSVFQNSRLKYGNPIDIDDVANDFPGLVMLMAHGGRTAWYEEAMTMVRLHANVYIELSGLSVTKLLKNFPDMERFSHKFVFGTDWPQVDTRASIAKLRALGMAEAAQTRILGGNAATLLGIA